MKSVPEKTRNGLIDLMRLLFAGFIMLYHFFQESGYIIGGRYGVEFFIILSGFLFFAGWEKWKAANPDLDRQGKLAYWKSYTKKRYFRFFWYALIAFIPIFLIVRHESIQSITGLQSTLSKDVWEIFMTKMVNGFNKEKALLNNAAWTLGPMLFVEYLILGLLVYWEKPFLTLLMPCFVIMASGYFMNAENVNNYHWLGLFTCGMLRICILTCVGIFSYWLCQNIKRHPLTPKGRWCLTALELLCYLWCIYTVFFLRTREYQFCFIVVIAIAIAITLSGRSNTIRWFPQTKLTDFCAEWSLAIYLTHITVKRWFQYAYPDAVLSDILFQHKYIAVLAALALSVLYLFVMRGIFRLLPKLKTRLKGLLVKTS